jgi:hypothetical protein
MERVLRGEIVKNKKEEGELPRRNLVLIYLERNWNQQ